jgi:Poly(ADP-ribose) polymerase catalytic domain/ARTD15 N-terminal domain
MGIGCLTLLMQRRDKQVTAQPYTHHCETQSLGPQWDAPDVQESSLVAQVAAPTEGSPAPLPQNSSPANRGAGLEQQPAGNFLVGATGWKLYIQLTGPHASGGTRTWSMAPNQAAQGVMTVGLGSHANAAAAGEEPHALPTRSTTTNMRTQVMVTAVPSSTTAITGGHPLLAEFAGSAASFLAAWTQAAALVTQSAVDSIYSLVQGLADSVSPIWALLATNNQGLPALTMTSDTGTSSAYLSQDAGITKNEPCTPGGRSELRTCESRALDFISRDPHVADLLISMVAASAKCVDQRRRELLLPTYVFPPAFVTREGQKDWDGLARTLDSLPAIESLLSAPQQISKTDSRLPGCLNWIEWLEGHVELIPGDVEHEDWSIFLVKPTNVQVRRAFEARKRAAGGSSYYFHGSSFFNWYSILRTKLWVGSDTALQTHGASLGKGIYLANHMELSYEYAYPTPAWKNSRYGPTLSCFALCEVPRGAFQGIHFPAGSVLDRFDTGVVKDEDDVAIICLIVGGPNCKRKWSDYGKKIEANHLATLIKARAKYRKFMGDLPL